MHWEQIVVRLPEVVNFVQPVHQYTVKHFIRGWTRLPENELVINSRDILMYFRNTFNSKETQKQFGKEYFHKFKEIFYTVIILYLSVQPKFQKAFLPDTEALLQCYPQFANVRVSEQFYLLNFRNFMVLSLEVMQAVIHNKNAVLKIAGRLEGSGKEYHTGGCQKPETERRVAIYEHESGVLPMRRPIRLTEKLAQEAADLKAGKIPKTINGQTVIKSEQEQSSYEVIVDESVPAVPTKKEKASQSAPRLEANDEAFGSLFKKREVGKYFSAALLSVRKRKRELLPATPASATAETNV